MAEKKGNSFVKQASILMVAGLIVRMIGLLYRSPMREIIGDLVVWALRDAVADAGYYTDGKTAEEICKEIIQKLI